MHFGEITRDGTSANHPKFSYAVSVVFVKNSTATRFLSLTTLSGKQLNVVLC